MVFKKTTWTLGYLTSAHKTQVEFRSQFFEEESASYGPGNTVSQSKIVCWSLDKMLL